MKPKHLSKLNHLAPGKKVEKLNMDNKLQIFSGKTIEKKERPYFIELDHIPSSKNFMTWKHKKTRQFNPLYKHTRERSMDISLIKVNRQVKNKSMFAHRRSVDDSA